MRLAVFCRLRLRLQNTADSLNPDFLIHLGTKMGGWSVDVTMTRTGDPVGEVQWVVAKADDKWKLKDAPLP